VQSARKFSAVAGTTSLNSYRNKQMSLCEKARPHKNACLEHDATSGLATDLDVEENLGAGSGHLFRASKKKRMVRKGIQHTPLFVIEIRASDSHWRGINPCCHYHIDFMIRSDNKFSSAAPAWH
jgi:hypothetical protein